MILRRSLVALAVVSVSVRGLAAHVHESTPVEFAVIGLPMMAAMGFVPPPASEINGRYTWSTFQEANWKDYFNRHPYQTARNLPWLFGNFEVPVFVSPEPGDALLFEYSTYCLNWGGVPALCSGPIVQHYVPSGTITQVSYRLISVTGVFVRVKIKFFGFKGN